VKAAERCTSTERFLKIARSVGRSALADPIVAGKKNKRQVSACKRFDIEGCVYRAELVIVVASVGDIGATSELKLLDKQQCSDEIEFAASFGVAALRRHMELVQEAIEQAIDDYDDERSFSPHDGEPQDVEY
jgi:hypothetical protein